VLLLAEPDFGASVIMLATALGMLFLAGTRLLHFGLILCACVALLLGLIWAHRTACSA
jgi:cell division protein FtsW